METDRRGGYDLQGEVESDDAGVVEGADAMSTTARELGDGISQIGVFTEEENHRNISEFHFILFSLSTPFFLCQPRRGGSDVVGEIRDRYAPEPEGGSRPSSRNFLSGTGGKKWKITRPIRTGSGKSKWSNRFDRSKLEVRVENEKKKSRT